MSAPKEYLFIGGTNDGRRFAMSGAVPPSTARMPIRTRLTGIGRLDAEFAEEEYRRETLRSANGQEYFVYVRGDEDIIERLILCYKQP